FVGVCQLERLSGTTKDSFELAFAAEDEDVALAVAINDINVTVWSHVAVGELEAFADLVGWKLARRNGHEHFALQIALDDFLLAEHCGENEFSIAILTHHKT
ncbi:MAG: hypothetical protein ACK56I_27330, partial [bacterium]